MRLLAPRQLKPWHLLLIIAICLLVHPIRFSELVITSEGLDDQDILNELQSNWPLAAADAYQEPCLVQMDRLKEWIHPSFAKNYTTTTNQVYSFNQGRWRPNHCHPKYDSK